MRHRHSHQLATVDSRRRGHGFARNRRNLSTHGSRIGHRPLYDGVQFMLGRPWVRIVLEESADHGPEPLNLIGVLLAGSRSVAELADPDGSAVMTAHREAPVVLGVHELGGAMPVVVAAVYVEGVARPAHERRMDDHSRVWG